MFQFFDSLEARIERNDRALADLKEQLKLVETEHCILHKQLGLTPEQIEDFRLRLPSCQLETWEEQEKLLEERLESLRCASDQAYKLRKRREELAAARHWTFVR